MLVWFTAEPVQKTAENILSTYFIPSKPVELFVHHCGPSAQATPLKWGGKPMTLQSEQPHLPCYCGHNEILTYLYLYPSYQEFLCYYVLNEFHLMKLCLNFEKCFSYLLFFF